MASNYLLFPLLVLLSSVSSVTPAFKANITTNAKTACHRMEREALLRLKEGLKDPSNKLSSWSSMECCRWRGVSCNSQTGNVVKLDLSNPDCYEGLYMTYEGPQNLSCLGGKISPSLLDLKYLNHLDLSLNDFHGIPIPEFLGSLQMLTYLNLSFTSFSGMVPNNLGNLSNLHYLDLCSYSPYYFYGLQISDLYWITHLSSLEYLGLENVNLSLARTNWLQAINTLPSLAELHLDSCQLHEIPVSLPIVNFTSLSVLSLSMNQISSFFPQWIFNLSDLVHLKLSYNEFRGDVSVLIGGLSRSCNGSFESLYLWGNQFSGQLPDSLGFLNKLRILIIYANFISGPIPASIGNLSNLESLDVSYNQMNGSIPNSIGNLTELVALKLLKNSWIGMVTQSHLQGLRKLRYFSLSSSIESFSLNVSNHWVPPFSLQFLSIINCNLGPRWPTWLRSQKQLSQVVLSDVGISEGIPHWFWKLSPQIIWLELSNNQIGGTLPKSLEFPPETTIDLSSNRLEGLLPVWRNVSDLILANNLLSGSIPLSIHQSMSSLTYLNISGNFLSGGIPITIGKMEKLERLDLSNNKFSGKIHDYWDRLQNLQLLDLSINNLSGDVPISFFSLPKLYWLSLSGNMLSGELPFPKVNRTGLIVLDLGDNKFSGSVPYWIGASLKVLSVLRLRNNMFSSGIPREFCYLSNLHILDLAVNNLSGSIPTCLGNLSGFKVDTLYYATPSFAISQYISLPQVQLVVKAREAFYSKLLRILNIMDLSSNNLQGDIPEEIADLLSLGALNLSHNRLTGKIPEKIGNLQKLESLDLSGNQLSGPIPPSMTFIFSLSYLNLSHNNLSGSIPFSNQFQTFNDPSIYEGNAGLCGYPLSTTCKTSAGENTKDHGHVEEDVPDEDDYEKLGLYISIVLGFVFGFWAVIGSLVLKRSWRHAYFDSLNKVKQWLINCTRKTVLPATAAEEKRKLSAPMPKFRAMLYIR